MPGGAAAWLLYPVAALAGLCFGSFLNVVIHRLPEMLTRQWRAGAMEALDIRPPRRPRFNLAVPNSRCPRCGAAVAVKDNVPLLGWLRLRGKCRACAERIPIRYPLVEAAGGALAVLVLATWGATWPALAYYALLMALLAAAVIDWETLLLPDQITVPLVWLGLGAAFAFTATPQPVDAVLGAMGGYLLLWLFYWGHKLLTRREGMGYGDFKLLAALGAWLGWRAILPIILIACAAGIAYAVAGLARGTANRATPIPFGTFLCLGGAATLLMKRYLPAF